MVKYSAGAGQVPFPNVHWGKRWGAKALGGMMWFWIFYRAREVSEIDLRAMIKPVCEQKRATIVVALALIYLSVCIGF
jgi:hypothetical protein